MSFDYQKLKQKKSEEGGSLWTSYSDLFMVLSVVFLLLYVVASLRSGTFSVQKQMEFMKMSNEAEDLKRQIQAYNALKQDYLEKEASESEAQMYEELMSKLTLLQDEAKEEKRQLEAQAQDNADKAQALNQYQQMVRNIINTNMLAKKRIKTRDQLIVKRDDTIKIMDNTIVEQTKDINEKAQQISAKNQQITEQNNEISRKQAMLEEKKREVAHLASEIQSKEQTIASNQGKINALNSNLNQKIKELENTYNAATTTKAELNRKIVMMKLENAKKVNELNNQTKNMEASLGTINTQLAQANNQLQDANRKIGEQEALKKKLEDDIKDANANYQAKMAEMDKNFQNKIASERAALEKKLEGEKASAQEKMKALSDFKDKVAKERAELDGKLGELKGQVAAANSQLGAAQREADAAKGALADAKKDHDRYLAAIDGLKKERDGLSGDLARAQELANAKKKLADKIAKNLAQNGIKAGVDPKSGDVTINFGDEYFDTSRSDLKPNMKKILHKFMPIYSKSLFDDKNIAKEILSVEVVGFSSPTYKGKYVDPQSLAEGDRAAVAYNLDLSYYRAKSIFSYIFDKKEMNYNYQKDLLPLVKVTGRSFLAEEMKGRTIASSLTHAEYCAKYSCEKSQKVIIKFNLKD